MQSATHRNRALVASAAVHAAILAFALLAGERNGATEGAPFRLVSLTMTQPSPAGITGKAANTHATATRRTRPVDTPPAVASAVPASVAAPTAQSPLVAAPAPQIAPVVDTSPAHSPAPKATEPDRASYARLLWARINARKPTGQDLVGRTLVTFTLDGQGRLLTAGITQSSGQMLLDKLALRAVHAAAPFPPPPADSGEGSMAFTVELVFGL